MRVIYTSTPSYFSSSSLQYFAIFNVSTSSFRPLALAPVLLESCPGSNATMISPERAEAVLADALRVLTPVVSVLTAFSASAILSCALVTPFSSIVTTEASISSLTSDGSPSIGSRSSRPSYSLFTPNSASIPCSDKFNALFSPCTARFRLTA